MNKYPPNEHIPTEMVALDEILLEATSRFDTPLYAYDVSLLEQRWNWLRTILPDKVSIYYSVKANPNVRIIDIFRKLGANFEIASSGELTAAMHAGVSPADMIFVGPGKTRSELENAIVCNLGVIVAESRREIDILQELSICHNHTTRVALRINPKHMQGMAIAMSGATQFGMELQIALDLLKETQRYDHLNFIGLHAYLGTGILDWNVVLENTKIILQATDELQAQSGKELTFIDIGGGFGIPYHEKDVPPDWYLLKEPLAKLLNEYWEKHPHTETVVVESGRFLVGSSGIFLSRVLDEKETMGKLFVILDGGTNVFWNGEHYRGYRPTPIRILGSMSRLDPIPMTLCGPLCTSMDVLAVDVLLSKPKIGDIIAFYQAGAYGLTASPGLFLSHGFPCEILVHKNRLSLIRERSSSEYLLMGQPNL